MTNRYDAAPVRLSKTPEGFLRGSAFATRIGVFTYRRADGTTARELRHPDEVFAPASLDTLAGKVLTLEHPHAPVTSANARSLSVGSVGDLVTTDGRFVRASVTVTDAAAVREIEAGRKRELSCGYTCDVVDEPGEYNGERYDSRQTNIRYNHLALVARGRAGPEVSVRLDSTDAVCVDTHDVIDVNPEAEMIKVRIDGVDYDATEQVAQALVAHDFKTAEEIKAAKAEAEKAKGRADALEAELAKARSDSDPTKFAAAVAERVALESKAAKVIGAEFKADGLSDDEIRRAVIAKVSPEAKLDGRSADYVAARFDAALEAADAKDAKAAKATETAAAARTAATKADTADEDKVGKAQRAMRERAYQMHGMKAPADR